MPEHKIDGEIRDPYRKMHFRVREVVGNPQDMEFHPFGGPNVYLPFTEVSGLRDETEVIEWKEGDRVFKRKIPGGTNFDNIVLTKGVDTSRKLRQWRERVKESATQVEQKAYRSVLAIDLMPRGHARGNVSPIRTWVVSACWPVSLDCDDLSGTAGDVMVERLELAVEKVTDSYAVNPR